MPHDPQSTARDYVKQFGERLGLPTFDEKPSDLALNSELSRRAGAAFEALKHEPGNPEVQRAYNELKREVLLQYAHMVQHGMKIEPWRHEGQPYANSKEMVHDVRHNGHLWYFPTDVGFGGDDRFNDHPLYETVPGTDVKYNDLFRAVHDYFGHAVHGHQFGPKGEQRAWHEHAKMFSPLARRALTTDTHGQNSWVNFGPHEPEKLPVLERPYADQKAGLLPESAWPLTNEELTNRGHFDLPPMPHEGEGAHKLAAIKLTKPQKNPVKSINASARPVQPPADAKVIDYAPPARPEDVPVFPSLFKQTPRIGPAARQWALENADRHLTRYMAMHGYTEPEAAREHLMHIFLAAGLAARKDGNRGGVYYFTHPHTGRRMSIRVGAPAKPPFPRGAPTMKLGRLPEEGETVAGDAQGPPLHVQPGESVMGTDFIHPIHNAAGERVGHVWVTPNHETGNLHINHIGAAGHTPNAVGLEGVRGVFRQLKTFYPTLKTITGTRVSGRRQGNVVSAKFARKKKDSGTPMASERDQLIQAASRGHMNQEYTPMLVLADKLDELGEPGGNLLRHSYAAKVQHGESAYRQLAYSPDAEEARHSKLGVKVEVGQAGPFAQHYRPVLAVTHWPDDENQSEPALSHSYHTHYIPVRSKAHFRELLRDLPRDLQEGMIRQMLAANREYHVLHLLPDTAEGDGPVKLARVAPQTQQGQGGAMAGAGSVNHEAKLQVVREILKEAGLTPATVRAAIAHEGGASKPSFASVVKRAVHPDHLRYTAAWLGLMTGNKNMAVAQPDPNGEDFLHVISAPAQPDHLTEALRSAGINKFTTERTAAGIRAYVLNPLGKLPVEQVARTIPNASHTVSRVRVYRLGAGESTRPAASGDKSSTDASARNAYRSVIDDFERAAKTGD